MYKLRKLESAYKLLEAAQFLMSS